MGASWRRGSAASLLLVLAAALAPATLAGSAADPELTDPAGDQDVDTGTVPIVPGVNDVDFGDVDVVAAWFEPVNVIDCVGEPAAECPPLDLIVQTTNGWTTGSMTLTFSVERGPTSLSGSTASGQAVSLAVNGTQVTGAGNASAASTPDGLRIRLGLGAIGAVGGDLLANLTIATTRTDLGALQGVDQDDQTATDDAGPGRAFMVPRVEPRAAIDLSVVSIDGAASPLERRGSDPFDVVVRITNLGTDPDRFVAGLSYTATGADGKQQALAVDLAPPSSGTLLAPGDSQDRTFSVVPPGLDGLHTMDLSITAASERGAQDNVDVHVAFHVDAPVPGEREVKPAGLTRLPFLTTGAEALGFDGLFGSYGEAVVLAFLILLTILALFLLLALGRSTTKGEPAPEAPWPAERAMPAAFAGPGGVAETVRATGPPPQAAPAEDVPADFGALAAAAEQLATPEPAPPVAAAPLPTAAEPMRIRIEEVRHTPSEPEAGQGVTTEVILRNEGPSATLRIALSVDGKPAAERTVQVPSRATKAVELPWTAGAGDNRVRIQAFPA